MCTLQAQLDRRHLSLAVPRLLVEKLGLSAPGDVSRRVKRLIDPSSEAAGSGLTPGLSLTEGIGPSGQIRYALVRRSRRALIELADSIDQGLLTFTRVRVGIESAHLDAGSKYFIELVNARCRRLSIAVVEPDGSHPTLPLTEEEVDVSRIHARCGSLTAGDVQLLARYAWRHLRAGDAWAISAILDPVPERNMSSSTNHACAIACVALGQPEAAELYFRAWIDGAPALGKARAKYGLAMLYARHHNLSNRDDELARRILDDAMLDLEQARRETPGLDTTFEEVFNRNGYALLEFRAGKITEALALLSTGASRLPDDSERNHLHRSVLLYNAAQVHRRSGSLDRAVDLYKEVLTLDPHMPEYHCELAQCYISLSLHEQAYDVLRHALSLDPFIPQTHSMLGFVAAQMGETDVAIAHYSSAWDIEPTPATCYALAFHLIDADQLEAALTTLLKYRLEQVPLGLLANFSAALAEVHVGLQQRDRAVEVLTEAVRMVPDDSRIRRNLAWAARH